jgi:hypothetical protein
MKGTNFGDVEHIKKYATEDTKQHSRRGLPSIFRSVEYEIEEVA